MGSLLWTAVMTTLTLLSCLLAGAAVVHPNTRKNFYFCRVEEAGSYIVGHLEAGKKQCAYPRQGKTARTDKFKVLVTSGKLGWRYGGSPPTGAVDCELTKQNSDCYLGQSVYSDGICHEDLGFITPSIRRITMADRTGAEVSTCPFFFFLVEE